MYSMRKEVEVDDLFGKTATEIQNVKNGERLIFKIDDGTSYHMFHRQD